MSYSVLRRLLNAHFQREATSGRSRLDPPDSATGGPGGTTLRVRNRTTPTGTDSSRGGVLPRDFDPELSLKNGTWKPWFSSGYGAVFIYYKV